MKQKSFAEFVPIRSWLFCSLNYVDYRALFHFNAIIFENGFSGGQKTFNWDLFLSLGWNRTKTSCGVTGCTK